MGSKLHTAALKRSDELELRSLVNMVFADYKDIRCVMMYGTIGKLDGHRLHKLSKCNIIEYNGGGPKPNCNVWHLTSLGEKLIKIVEQEEKEFQMRHP